MSFFRPIDIDLKGLSLGHVRMNGGAKTVSLIYQFSTEDGQAEDQGLGFRLPPFKVIWEPSAAPGTGDTTRLTICLQVSDDVLEFMQAVDDRVVELASQHSLALCGKSRTAEEMAQTYKSQIHRSRLGNSLKSKINTTGSYELMIRNNGFGGGVTMSMCDVSLKWAQQPSSIRPNPFLEDDDEEMPEE